MPEKTSQNLSNHARTDPPFHFFLLPTAAISLLGCLWRLIRQPGLETAWLMLVAMAAVVAVFKIRLYALKVQDRLIRLEERLRIAPLVPEPLRARLGELKEDQWVALRFASDGEVAGLVEKALGGLSRKEIKQAIRQWRPDYFRV